MIFLPSDFLGRGGAHGGFDMLIWDYRAYSLCGTGVPVSASPGLAVAVRAALWIREFKLFPNSAIWCVKRATRALACVIQFDEEKDEER